MQKRSRNDSAETWLRIYNNNIKDMAMEDRALLGTRRLLIRKVHRYLPNIPPPVNPIDNSSAPLFHQSMPQNAAEIWDAFVEQSNNRKHSLTSAHPEMGPNGYRNPAMGTGMNDYPVGKCEYVSSNKAWSGAPRGVPKRPSGTSPTKRSSFSKSGLGPKVVVQSWASGGSSTRRPIVNGSTKANPIRVSNSPVGNLATNPGTQMMSPALTPTSPEVPSTSAQDMMLPSPKMTADQSVGFLKASLLEDPNFNIRDLGIQPAQKGQLSSILQAQIHHDLLAPPQAPALSLDSPLDAAVEA